MIEAAAIFLLLFVAVTAELMAGGVGLVMPATAAAVFYLGGVMGWRQALPVAVAAGIWLDLLFGRTWLCGAVGLALVCFGSQFWPTGERTPAVGYALPGALCGILTAMIPGGFRLLVTPSCGLADGLALAGQILVATILGALLLPTMMVLLDALAVGCGLPPYGGSSGSGSPRELGGTQASSRGGR